MPSKYYADLREYLKRLEDLNLLHRYSKPIVKETQLTSLVRLQFRGLPEEKRRGFLFEDVRDFKGRKYDMKVATGILASSKRIYALGLNCDLSEIGERWAKAQVNPIEPEIVSSGPSQEVVCTGDDLLKDGRGVEELPIPVEVPGFSGQIRTSNSAFITKDVETGIRNVGIYSGHVFGKTQLLWEMQPTHHGEMHWKIAKKQGKPLPAAIAVGATPNVSYTAAANVPYGVDELSVAGGLAGEPVKLVKCKTVDIEVPASAEVVIEGLVSTEYVEPGNAFGEYTGYMAIDIVQRPVFQVTCVTHRKDAIFTHMMSQMPPSESSMLRTIGVESTIFKFLKYSCRFEGILDVALTEMSQGRLIVVKLKKIHRSQPAQVLHALVTQDPMYCKLGIVVDDDIDIRDLESVVWALSFRMQPERDMTIVRGRYPELDVSAYNPDAPFDQKDFPDGRGSSAVLIDATRKWGYPPISLPRKEYMDAAIALWKEEGLPELSLRQPWFGYELGYWPEQYAKDAENIVKGDHYKVGERLAKEKKKV